MRGYVKRLLGIELGASINIKPIAQKLEVPEETQNEIIQNFWHKDEEQLESVLQHWMNENGNSENPAALRSALEGLNREGTSASLLLCSLYSVLLGRLLV